MWRFLFFGDKMNLLLKKRFATFCSENCKNSDSRESVEKFFFTTKSTNLVLEIHVSSLQRSLETCCTIFLSPFYWTSNINVKWQNGKIPRISLDSNIQRSIKSREKTNFKSFIVNERLWSSKWRSIQSRKKFFNVPETLSSLFHSLPRCKVIFEKKKKEQTRDYQNRDFTLQNETKWTIFHHH